MQRSLRSDRGQSFVYHSHGDTQPSQSFREILRVSSRRGRSARESKRKTDDNLNCTDLGDKLGDTLNISRTAADRLYRRSEDAVGVTSGDADTRRADIDADPRARSHRSVPNSSDCYSRSHGVERCRNGRDIHASALCLVVLAAPSSTEHTRSQPGQFTRAKA